MQRTPGGRENVSDRPNVPTIAALLSGSLLIVKSA
jgi:hypothetical protein